MFMKNHNHNQCLLLCMSYVFRTLIIFFLIISVLLTGGAEAAATVPDGGNALITAYSGGAGTPAYQSDAAITAYQARSSVLVDGAPYAIEAYTIANSSYFRLRGLAAAVNCYISYDAVADRILIDTSRPYAEPDGALPVSVSGAMPTAAVGAATGTAAEKITSDVIINGIPVKIEAYMIGGYNYFKLRDFLSAADIGVWFDQKNNVIHIETNRVYDPDYHGPPSGGGTFDSPGGGEAFVPVTANAGGAGVYADSEAPITEQQYVKYCVTIVDLINAERIAQGLNCLEEDDGLDRIARFRCEDMAVNDYFAHTSPVYGDLQKLFGLFGVEYHTIGENIGMGFATPENVMKAWMNSDNHRHNILEKKYQYVGIGISYDEDGIAYWAQIFWG